MSIRSQMENTVESAAIRSITKHSTSPDSRKAMGSERAPAPRVALHKLNTELWMDPAGRRVSKHRSNTVALCGPIGAKL